MTEKEQTMTKRMRTALLTTVATRAFDSGQPGWKKDADGKIEVDGSGNPIWLNSNGEEAAVKGDTISALNAEAKQHRTRAEKAEGDLARYKGPDGKLVDPDAAIKAVDTVSKLDAKKLIDAGEVDKVREAVAQQFAGQMSEKDNAIAERDGRINNMMIDSVFKGSDFIGERVAMPRDFFEAAMRNNFKVEDGKVVAYDRTGNRLLSKKNAGDFAAPDEALELLVDMHPQKDTILKPDTGGGSGNGGGGGARGGSRTMKRSEFSAADPMKKAEYAAQAGKGELSIID